MPRRTYCPAADPTVLERLRNSGVIVEMAPVPVEHITQRSAMILHASQHGILSLAAFAGLPQVGIPQHLEQVFHGRRAGQQGILNQIEFGQRSKQAVIDMVSRVYHDPAMRARARDFALHLRAITPVNTQNVLKERINAFRADRF
jgi:UDP:flavonoid glycosyltransferase YjiC (YdhE family)